MEVFAPSTGNLVFGMFDRNGRLKHEFLHHPVEKGLALWGEESNSGPLLMVDHVEVNTPHRRKGVARRMLLELVRKVEKGTPLPIFAVAHPNTIANGARAEPGHGPDCPTVRSNLRNVFRSFFQAVGFRRVGNSSLFALAADQSHPSHQISAANDCVPPVTQSSISGSLKMTMVQKVIRSSDVGILALLESQFSDISPGASQWRETYITGNTIMHIVAIN
jgi:hypothetical protein